MFTRATNSALTFRCVCSMRVKRWMFRRWTCSCMYWVRDCVSVWPIFFLHYFESAVPSNRICVDVIAYKAAVHLPRSVLSTVFVVVVRISRISLQIEILTSADQLLLMTDLFECSLIRAALAQNAEQMDVRGDWWRYCVHLINSCTRSGAYGIRNGKRILCYTKTVIKEYLNWIQIVCRRYDTCPVANIHSVDQLIRVDRMCCHWIDCFPNDVARTTDRQTHAHSHRQTLVRTQRTLITTAHEWMDAQV